MIGTQQVPRSGIGCGPACRHRVGCYVCFWSVVPCLAKCVGIKSMHAKKFLLLWIPFFGWLVSWLVDWWLVIDWSLIATRCFDCWLVDWLINKLSIFDDSFISQDKKEQHRGGFSFFGRRGGAPLVCWWPAGMDGRGPVLISQKKSSFTTWLMIGNNKKTAGCKFVLVFWLGLQQVAVPPACALTLWRSINQACAADWVKLNAERFDKEGTCPHSSSASPACFQHGSILSWEAFKTPH